MIRTLSAFLTSTILTGAALVAQTGTAVGGPIATNTTWGLKGSPYRAQSSILIVRGAKLTIQPGVVVEFGKGQTITVGLANLGGGILDARGTSSKPIRFTHLARKPGSWGSILFSPQAVSATFNQAGKFVGGCILQHCVVEFGGGGGAKGAVEALDSAPFLDHCEVTASLTRGLSVVLNGAGTLTLRAYDCGFTSCGTEGGVIQSGKNHDFRSCRFVSNKGSGLSVSSATGVTLARCTMSKNSGRGLTILSGSASLVECSLVDNTVPSRWGGGGGLLASSTASFNLDRCRILRNSSSDIGGGCSVQGVRQLNITNTICRDNQARSSGGGWMIQSTPTTIRGGDCLRNSCSAPSGRGGGLDLRASTTMIDGLTIAGNRCPGSSGAGGGISTQGSSLTLANSHMHCNSTGQRGGGICIRGKLTLTNTVLTSNEATEGGAIYFERGSTGSSIAGTSATAPHNTFLGNKAKRGTAVFNGMPYHTSGSGDIPADWVCWGGLTANSKPNANPSLIWDFFDIPAFGVVAAFNEIQCGPIAGLGGGLGPKNKPPILSAAGTMVTGSPFSLAMSRAPSNALGFLLVNITCGLADFAPFGAVIVPNFQVAPVLLPWPTGATGSASLKVAKTPGLPMGLPIYLQAIVADPKSPNGQASISNAVLAVKR